MLLTPQQLQEIRQIIEDHHDAFIVNALGTAALAPEAFQRLKDLGLVDPKVESIKDSYIYGQLLGQLESKQIASMS